MREKWVDAVKAIAVLCVLLGHAGAGIPLISGFSVLFYVPVFFVLAGYLHHHRPEESYGTYLGRRAKRLLVPYFGYSLFLLLFSVFKEIAAGSFVAQKALRSLGGILLAVNTIVPSGSVSITGEPLLDVWNSPLWFLPALFLAELLFEGMLRLFRGRQRRMLWAGVWCLVLGIAAHYMLPILLPWSLKTVPVLEVFLMAGWQIKRNGSLKRIAEKPLWMLAVTAFAGMLRIWNGPVNLSIGFWGGSLVCGVLACLSASVVLMAVCFRFRDSIPEGLSLIGQNTMPVFCLHMFLFMFLQAGIGLFVPEFPDGGTWQCELGKIAMVLLTVDILVIGGIGAGQIKGRYRTKRAGEKRKEE